MISPLGDSGRAQLVMQLGMIEAFKWVFCGCHVEGNRRIAKHDRHGLLLPASSAQRFKLSRGQPRSSQGNGSGNAK